MNSSSDTSLMPDTSGPGQLADQLARLEQIMLQVKETGMDGVQLAGRIRGDLDRLMNTAWLNCADLIHRHERHQKSAMPMAAKAAIEFAVENDAGMSFLKLWMEGQYDVIRREWPEAPLTIYVSPDIIL